MNFLVTFIIGSLLSALGDSEGLQLAPSIIWVKQLN